MPNTISNRDVAKAKEILKGTMRNPGKVAEMAAKEAEERRKDEEFLKKMKSTKGSTQRSAASENAYSYSLGGKVDVMECGGAKNALRGKKFSGTY